MIIVFDSCLVVEESHVIVLLDAFSFIIQDAQLYVRTAVSLKLEMKKRLVYCKGERESEFKRGNYHLYSLFKPFDALCITGLRY